jgi:hypothetical protein
MKMTVTIELFINLTMISYILFLLIPYIEKIIDFIGKIITIVVKYFVKIFIIVYTYLLLFSWLLILGKVVQESFNFYINNNYKINQENIKNITVYNFEKIFSKRN